MSVLNKVILKNHPAFRTPLKRFPLIVVLKKTYLKVKSS